MDWLMMATGAVVLLTCGGVALAASMLSSQLSRREEDTMMRLTGADMRQRLAGLEQRAGRRRGERGGLTDEWRA